MAVGGAPSQDTRERCGRAEGGPRDDQRRGRQAGARGQARRQARLRIGPTKRVIDVHALAERRGPASEAALLYTESEDSIKARSEAAEQRRLTRPRFDDGGGRPTKRDRRRPDRERDR